jgi:diacylglycerol kinase (ATP)
MIGAAAADPSDHPTPPAVATAVVAINRKAGRARADLGPAIERLGRGERRPTVLDIEDPSEIVPKLRAACGNETRTVVVAGGDGTVNSALPLLLERRVTLGILPLGTANDLARTLELPTDPVEAAEVISAGHTRCIDVGTANEQYFLNAAGLGFSATLNRELGAKTKTVLGPLAYALGALRQWRKQRPFTVVVNIEGTVRRHRVIQLTVANGRFYGGGATAHASACIDDGLLDVLLLLPRPLHHYVVRLARLKRGAHGGGPIVTYRGERLSLETRRPRDISTDGEASTATPAVFRVYKRALNVFTPHGPAQERTHRAA